MSYNNSKENIKKEISNEDLKIEYVQKNAVTAREIFAEYRTK